MATWSNWSGRQTDTPASYLFESRLFQLVIFGAPAC
jgi:hypothetical protein